jgi:integrase
LGQAWQDTGLVFGTRTGRPIGPRNLVRSFHRICAAHGLRDIKVHHLRHTNATLLKNLRGGRIPCQRGHRQAAVRAQARRDVRQDVPPLGPQPDG